MPVPQNICNLIIDLHNKGLPVRAIGQRLNVPKSTVQNIIQRQITQGSTLTRYRGRCGRPRRLSKRDERALARASVTNPLATARQLQASIGGNVATVSLPTVKRALRRQGRISYRPRKSPSLNARQRLARLQWCRQYVNWTEEDWKKVSFRI